MATQSVCLWDRQARALLISLLEAQAYAKKVNIYNGPHLLQVSRQCETVVHPP